MIISLKAKKLIKITNLIKARTLIIVYINNKMFKIANFQTKTTITTILNPPIKRILQMELVQIIRDTIQIKMDPYNTPMQTTWINMRVIPTTFKNSIINKVHQIKYLARLRLLVIYIFTRAEVS